jgi:hypothetical protein
MVESNRRRFDRLRADGARMRIGRSLARELVLLTTASGNPSSLGRCFLLPGRKAADSFGRRWSMVLAGESFKGQMCAGRYPVAVCMRRPVMTVRR